MQLDYDTCVPRNRVNMTANSDLGNRVRNENGNLSAPFGRTMHPGLTI